MAYWLIKSEPSAIGIDDMQNFPKQTIEWFGVRNYQARNFMRDEMQINDKALFWHSSCKEPGIYGIVKVVMGSHPDSHQFDINSQYFDSKATCSKPIWMCVDFQFVAKTKYLPITELRKHAELCNMQVLQKGNRLSITKVSTTEWEFIMQLLGCN